MPVKHCLQNVWLLKPANANQGKGIEIFSNLKNIIEFFEERSPGSKWVVQKYLERPLLWHGRKFDIRLLVAATSKGDLFQYAHSYLRTSSQEYDH